MRRLFFEDPVNFIDIGGMPVSYVPGFVSAADSAFEALWSELEWERRGSTPRREYYANDIAVPYVYGRGVGVREYLPRDWHPQMRELQSRIEAHLAARMEVCFLNGYEDGSDHLGWHADDSPEMDDARPIAIVTLGAERDIWFRANETPGDVARLKLAHGSLCVMHAGMQCTHQHRIPKAGFVCGPRVSLTFRGYVSGA